MTTVDRRHALVGLATAVAAVAAITLVVYPLGEVAPVVSTGVVYLLAVLLVSSRWGLWLGLATAVLSAAAFNFFHLPPTGGFTIASESNWVALVVFLVAAAVTSTLAGAARARAADAEQRRREADLGTEMARLLLGGAEPDEALPAVGRRIAETFGLASVEIDTRWVDSDRRRRAVPLVVEGTRAGTLLVPVDTDQAAFDALQDRVVPALETLLTAAAQRTALEAQVVETKALRRSNVVKTALLRSVSHDLRSPLTAISAAAGGLRSETLPDSERRELVAVIATETERLERLVRDLLDLSRVQSGAVDPHADWCSVEELVRSAAEAVAGAGDAFDVDVDVDLPLIRVDAAQVDRALVNVLENASRFAGADPVAIRARDAGKTVVVRVTDRGPGIPRDELERVFEPFHRASGQDGGSGLGLAIARGFLEANGGRIRAESLPGQGTSFVIALPCGDGGADGASELAS